MNIETERSAEQPVFTHISELLRSVDRQLLELDKEGDRSSDARDLEAYQASERAQSEVFAGLADQVEAFRAAGGEVPEDVDSAALFYTASARRALGQGRSYTRVVLFPRGARLDDPTSLEQLAAAHEPPAAAPVNPE